MSKTTKEGFITHGGRDRGYKNCKCRGCKIVARCTPLFDFYTIDDDGIGPLYCEVCFGKYCSEVLSSNKAKKRLKKIGKVLR